MRNVFLAVLLVLTALTIAGCDQTGQSQGTGFSGSSSTVTAPTAGSSFEQAPPPPPPSRNTTTQPLPSGWNYIRSGDLSAGPLSN